MFKLKYFFAKKTNMQQFNDSASAYKQSFQKSATFQQSFS